MPLIKSEPLVMTWEWQPVPPTPLEQPLPLTSFRDDAAFHCAAADKGIGEDATMAAFHFSFAQLARETPDLRFYRLIQLFNTPLLSLTTRDAGQTEFALWRGRRPEFRSGFKWTHLWFFRDGRDKSLVVVEYGFEGGLTLWSDGKPEAGLRAHYAEICAWVHA